MLDLSPAGIRALYARFAVDAASNGEGLRQLKMWAGARRRWAEIRAAASPEFLFERAMPSADPKSDAGWRHPVADAAPELHAWAEKWVHAAVPLRDEFSDAFANAVAQLETDGTALTNACDVLAQTALGRSVPVALVSPALSASAPERLVVLCDAWASMVGQTTGTMIGNTLAALADANRSSLSWLTVAEGDDVKPALRQFAVADRFGAFCSWLGAQTNPAEARFDVTEDRYKKWPPMW